MQYIMHDESIDPYNQFNFGVFESNKSAVLVHLVFSDFRSRDPLASPKDINTNPPRGTILAQTRYQRTTKYIFASISKRPQNPA